MNFEKTSWVDEKFIFMSWPWLRALWNTYVKKLGCRIAVKSSQSNLVTHKATQTTLKLHQLCFVFVVHLLIGMSLVMLLLDKCNGHCLSTFLIPSNIAIPTIETPLFLTKLHTLLSHALLPTSHTSESVSCILLQHDHKLGIWNTVVASEQKFSQDNLYALELLIRQTQTGSRQSRFCHQVCVAPNGVHYKHWASLTSA